MAKHKNTNNNNQPSTPKKKSSTNNSGQSTPTKNSPSKSVNSPKKQVAQNLNKATQAQHAYPAYKRRFRVLLMGFPANATNQQVMSHFKIAANQVHGIQIPNDHKDVAFAYFVTHNYALEAVNTWSTIPNKVGYMFLQRVHASVKYQIKLDFGCESLSKVLEHIPDIVGMNYTPSTRFWAVSTKDAVVDNKPDFLSEIDTSVTTFRLKWHPDATVDWKELKQSISTTWKVPSEHIQVNGLGNLIQAEIKKDHLVNASVSKVLYVNSVTIQNLSFNPRLGKPTLLTKVTELIQQKCSTMIPTSSGGSVDPKVLDNLVSKDDFNNLKKDFEKRINELSLENSSLKTDVANLTSNVAKLSTELENLNTITTNLNKEAMFSKSQPAQLSDLSDKTAKLFKVFDDLTKSVDSLKDELLKMSSTNSTEHTEFQSKISKLDSSKNAVEKTNQSQQKCIDEVICPTIDRHSLELKKHLSFIKGVENRIDEVCTLNKPNSGDDLKRKKVSKKDHTSPSANKGSSKKADLSDDDQ